MKRLLKWLGGLLLLLLLLGLSLAGWRAWAPPGAEPQAPVAGAPSDLPASVSRGQYLAAAADCVACHTAPGGAAYAGGREFKLPFGRLYSTNLTPDPSTGIGAWSDQAFVDAVRRGQGSHGRLYPAMPYTSYSGLSRADMIDIKRYLASLTPIHQPVPANRLAFPFNVRQGMWAWNLLFFKEQRFQPRQDRSAAWNRGAYLAGPLGHCGECHTPRNLGFAMKSHDYLAGTVVEGWKAYNTTSDAAYGIGGWSDQQLQGYLAYGHAPGRSSAAGPMAEVVEHSLQYLTASDMQALLTYLKSVAPQSGSVTTTINLQPRASLASNPVLPAASPGGSDRGLHLFASDCAGCHQWNGAGRESIFAGLQGSHAANDSEGLAIAQVILKGSAIHLEHAHAVMPGFAASYSDADVAAVANYVLAHFGDKPSRLSAAQVKAIRESD